MAPTHNGPAFQAFFCDLLHYSLPRYRLEWPKLLDEFRSSMMVFREEFGEAVMLFRDRHADEFRERILEFTVMECSEDVFTYVEQSAIRIFKGNVPLMELIVFCAFFLDLAVYCLRKFDFELFMEIIDELSDIFDTYVKKYFSIVGGWCALHQVAAQYTYYVHLVASIDSALSTEPLAVAHNF